MSRKSRTPKKKHREKPARTAATATPPVDQARSPCYKTIALIFKMIGTIAALLGLLSLIPLLPRLSASSEPPYQATDLVPTFTVTNEGEIKVTDVVLACYIWKTTFTRPNLKLGHASVSPVGKQETLLPSIPVTVPCKIELLASPDLVASVDLGIIVQFRPWPFTFLRKTTVFRFVGTNDGNHLVWRKQPSDEMLPDVEKDIAQFPLE